MHRLAITLTSRRGVLAWSRAHPQRATSIAGWYQQLAGVFSAFITIPYVLKVLTAEQSGLWFTFQGFLAVAALTDFGFSLVITRQVAYTLGKRTDEESDPDSDFIKTRPGWQGVLEIYQSARLLYLRAALAGLLVLVAAHELIMPLTKLNESNRGSLGVCWYALGLATLVTIQTRLSQSILDGAGLMHITKTLSGTTQILSAIGTILALHLKGTMLAASVSILAFSLVPFFCLRALLLHQGAGALRHPQPNATLGTTGRLWKIAMPLGVVTSSAYCVSSIQVPLLGSILGPTAVAPYYLAQRIGQAMTLAIMQLLQPQLPAFTLECSTGNVRAARHRMVRVLAAVTGFSLLGCVAYFAASPPFAAAWLGKGHFISRSVLGLMSLEYLFLCCSTASAQFVIAAGRNPFMWTTLLHGVLNITLAGCLSMRFGILGLPIAGLAAGFCSNYLYGPYRAARLLRSLQPALSSSCAHSEVASC